MVNSKPTTLWAVVSLVCSVLGWLAILAFLALAERYEAMANRSAGVGAIWMIAHMMLAGALCLLGVLFGLVALVRIRSGQCGGRGKAWTGIVLGCLPLASEVVSFLTSSADSNPFR
jgi:hypothetical protein